MARDNLYVAAAERRGRAETHPSETDQDRYWDLYPSDPDAPWQDPDEDHEQEVEVPSDLDPDQCVRCRRHTTARQRMATTWKNLQVCGGCL